MAGLFGQKRVGRGEGETTWFFMLGCREGGGSGGSVVEEQACRGH
jgi:hypothetical protein